jgi:hypothetical protein
VHIGIGVFTFALFLSSYAQNLWQFTLLFGCLVNIGAGLFYNIPVYIAVKCFPAKEGLMTSLVMFSCGIGTIFFTLFTKTLINPDNEKALIKVTEGDMSYNYFQP